MTQKYFISHSKKPDPFTGMTPKLQVKVSWVPAFISWHNSCM